MKLSKTKRNNLIFLLVIALMIIPQTRKPIQVMLHKGLALFGPSIESESNRVTINYQDWQLRDLEGNNLNFKDLKGKVVFLNFWATWCPPCIAEMKSVDQLYSEFKDDVAFVLVSGENSKVVKKFLAKKDYDLMSYTPQSKYPSDFNVTSIPRTFLINKNGEIVIDKGGAANWNSTKVRSLIKDLISE